MGEVRDEGNSNLENHKRAKEEDDGYLESKKMKGNFNGSEIDVSTSIENTPAEGDTINTSMKDKDTTGPKIESNIEESNSLNISRSGSQESNARPSLSGGNTSMPNMSTQGPSIHGGSEGHNKSGSPSVMGSESLVNRGSRGSTYTPTSTQASGVNTGLAFPDPSRRDNFMRSTNQVPLVSRSYSALPASGFQHTAQPGLNTRAEQDSNDPTKLNDALAVAGVDIQREEELLMQQQQNRQPRYNMGYLQNQFYNTRPALPATFLYPYHLASYMQKVARENGVVQSFYQDPEMLELMSAACEYWLSNIVTKTVMLSRHRRRGISSFNKDKKVPAPNQRSEFTRELRNLALKQREMEEKRVNKRLALGLEKTGENDSGESASKAGAEETLHRAANATAAMMTMNSGRKKYSWMTAGSGSGPDDVKGSPSADKGRASHLLAARGDNGLRYREIRTGNTVTMKDLLGALEDERMGTDKAIIKGYAKMKD